MCDCVEEGTGARTRDASLGFLGFTPTTELIQKLSFPEVLKS